MTKKSNHIDVKKAPQRDFYQPPEGYFETLPGKILERIDEDRQKKGRMFSRRDILYGIAASLAILAIVMIGFRNNKEPETTDDLLAKVPTSDLILYLQNSELDTYDIVESIDLDIWSEPLGDPATPTFNQEEMYLLYERYGVSPDENLQTF